LADSVLSCMCGGGVCAFSLVMGERVGLGFPPGAVKET
jgi:hypothetical protein